LPRSRSISPATSTTSWKHPLIDDSRDSSPTAGFQRALIHVESTVRKEVTGADMLVAIC
jgi:hypothetical protein